MEITKLKGRIARILAHEDFGTSRFNSIDNEPFESRPPSTERRRAAMRTAIETVNNLRRFRDEHLLRNPDAFERYGISYNCSAILSWTVESAPDSLVDLVEEIALEFSRDCINATYEQIAAHAIKQARRQALRAQRKTC